MAFEIVFHGQSKESVNGPGAYISVDIELTNSAGLKALTPECTSANELCVMADMLIRELEQLKRDAPLVFGENKNTFLHPSSGPATAPRSFR